VRAEKTQGGLAGPLKEEKTVLTWAGDIWQRGGKGQGKKKNTSLCLRHGRQEGGEKTGKNNPGRTQSVKSSKNGGDDSQSGGEDGAGRMLRGSHGGRYVKKKEASCGKDNAVKGSKRTSGRVALPEKCLWANRGWEVLSSRGGKGEKKYRPGGRFAPRPKKMKHLSLIGKDAREKTCFA